MNGIKDTFNSKIEKLQNENNYLVERLKYMENKINELKGIIIGRKIIKIIIKKIFRLPNANKYKGYLWNI